MDGKYRVLLTDEAKQDFAKLDKQNQKRALRVMELFEHLGQTAVDSRPLNQKGLFEIKTDKVRIYYMYADNRVIVVGLITLKKTQKAPERFKLQAMTAIRNYILRQNIRSL